MPVLVLKFFIDIVKCKRGFLRFAVDSVRAKLYTVRDLRAQARQQVIDEKGAQLPKERHGGARKRTNAAFFAALAAGMDINDSSIDD